jgi:hypothetical protein
MGGLRLFSVGCGDFQSGAEPIKFGCDSSLKIAADGAEDSFGGGDDLVGVLDDAVGGEAQVFAALLHEAGGAGVTIDGRKSFRPSCCWMRSERRQLRKCSSMPTRSGWWQMMHQREWRWRGERAGSSYFSTLTSSSSGSSAGASTVFCAISWLVPAAGPSISSARTRKPARLLIAPPRSGLGAGLDTGICT